ncbi:thiamine phosphate synthase [Vibrio sp. S9_S30]|uniref:thiamine phosphate synthase n=1 Tax=Vibrio sp. S9_S30 TaxID=2720226 RepID=UPI001680B7AD|nr:thiamine phosphate synthase [Vibrio sp. S9_S30]MBD1559625.1 thiamine phosphate synthase [Vibrio sp. S9_S30]
MAQLLLPSTQVELTGLVQTRLLLAQEQGFDIADIELGVSPTHLTQCYVDDRCVSLSFDKSDNEANYVCRFSNGQASPLAISQLSKEPNLLLIDVYHDFQLVDLWCDKESNRALSFSGAPLSKQQQQSYLAWLLTSLVLDFPIEDALVIARAAVRSDVSRETWPLETSTFPTPILSDELLAIHVGWDIENGSPFPKTNAEYLSLYPVVDTVEWVERLLEIGVKTTQLRIKNADDPDLETKIIKAIDLGRQHGAQVYINDYWQLAVLHGAYGVHLGQEDLEFADLDQIAKAGVRIGLSTHGYYEILRIKQVSPSYIALGHIFPTTTKVMPSRPQGLVRLKLYQKLAGKFPTVAIGGIDLERAAKVWQCGVSSLAVVRAITLSKDPKEVIDNFREILKSR